MRLTRKSVMVLVLALVAIFSVCAIISLQSKNNVYASGTVKTVSEVTYIMENGASVYSNADANKMGIRFGAYMSSEDYTALMNNVGEGKAYVSVKFGVVIAPSYYETNHGALDEANLFGAESIYDWAVWENDSWSYTSSGKIQVVNIESKRLDVVNNKASHDGSITTIRDENILNDFKGVAYMVAEKTAGGYEYAFATENDNVRNVAQVAKTHVNALQTEIDGGELDSTVAEEYKSEISLLKSTYINKALNTFEDNGTILGCDVDETTDYLYSEVGTVSAVYDQNFNKIPFAQDGANITIDNETLKAYGKGNKTPIYVKTASSSHVLTVYCASHVIDSAEDFIDFLNSYTGTSNGTADYYAIVTESFSCSETLVPKKQGNSCRFFGVFDGLGHEISGIGFESGFRSTLFGALQNCTIKDVAFTGVRRGSNNNSASSFFDYLYPGALVSNVYIEGTLPKSGLLYGYSGGSLNNVVIKGKADYSTGTMTAADISASIYNSFYIGTDSFSLKDTATLTTYASSGLLAKAIAEETVDLKAIGFNSNWKVVTEGATTTLYFGSVVVDAYTAE